MPRRRAPPSLGAGHWNRSGIAKQDVALPERGQHIGGGATVMRLAFGQLERDR